MNEYLHNFNNKEGFCTVNEESLAQPAMTIASIFCRCDLPFSGATLAEGVGVDDRLLGLLASGFEYNL